MSSLSGGEASELIMIRYGAHRELARALTRHAEDERVTRAVAGALWRTTYSDEAHRFAVEVEAPLTLTLTLTLHSPWRSRRLWH